MRLVGRGSGRGRAGIRRRVSLERPGRSEARQGSLPRLRYPRRPATRDPGPAMTPHQQIDCHRPVHNMSAKIGQSHKMWESRRRSAAVCLPLCKPPFAECEPDPLSANGSGARTAKAKPPCRFQARGGAKCSAKTRKFSNLEGILAPERSQAAPARRSVRQDAGGLTGGLAGKLAARRPAGARRRCRRSIAFSSIWRGARPTKRVASLFARPGTTTRRPRLKPS